MHGTEFIWMCAITYSIIHGLPVCDKTYDYIEVPENSYPGRVVTNITCTGPPGSLTYAISKGNTQGKFALNSSKNVGYLYVYQHLSFETRTTRFQLVIEVSENGPYRSSVNYQVDIQVTGINTYAPLFLFSPYTVYINEDTRPGSVISAPIPYDFDKGSDGQTTSQVLDGDAEDLFYMDPETAKVYLRAALDYEKTKDYVLTLQVSDFGLPERKSSTTVLNIHVKDVNDNSPVCSDTYITESFPETKYEGSNIKYLRCQDDDEGGNGRLTYNIVEGDYTKFRMQGSFLLLAKSIDVDKEPSVWSLTINVRDRGNPRLSTAVYVVLYVEGVDDNAPEWAAPEFGNYTVAIEEHSPVGTLVAHVSAHDADTQGTPDSLVLYYMDVYSSMFTMKPSTGDIYLSREIDREEADSYVIPVSAVSHNNPQDRISTNVIVSVVDVNDNSPEFEKDVFHFELPEDASTDTVVVSVPAFDWDAGENGLVRHRILGGDARNIFDINAKTGDIRLTGKLDYESTTSYTLFIQATDRGRPARWSTATAIISILPVNEFEPIFAEHRAIKVSEDVPIGTSLMKVKATDADGGNDGQLKYHIMTFNDTFIIEPSTGVIRTVVSLDRELLSKYQLKILAVDQSNNPKTGSAVVVFHVTDVNDNPPICTMFYSITLTPPINSGDKIEQLVCSDADEGPNAKFFHSITSGNTNNDFSIDTEGALVLLRKPTKAQYKFDILVSDSGSPSLNTKVVVVIETGSQPKFENLPHTVDVREDTVIGSLIYTMRASSISGRLKYSIAEADQSDDTSGANVVAKVDELTGKVYLWDELDREHISSYTITVDVKDMVSELSESSQIVLKVADVNDNNPQFDSSFYNISIVENIQSGKSLLAVTAKDDDADENGSVQYSIISGNDDNVFQISSSGVLSIRSTIDREMTNMFSIVIEAVDSGTEIQLTGTATVIIAVIDADEFPPEFIDVGYDFETNLVESAPLGALVFHMEARDLDVESNIQYSIDKQSSNYFLIDNMKGDIFLSRLLDRETTSLFELVVTAQNNRGVETTATVTVHVLDANDNDPLFSSNVFTFDVDEIAPIGYFVDVVSCTDADIDENGDISMSIVNGNTGNSFVMIGKRLLTNRDLNYDDISEYILHIEARDAGVPPRTSNAKVIVRVKPELRIPKFASDFELIHIPENTHLGSRIYNLDATFLGAREDIGGDIFYSIAEGNNDNVFTIDKFSGEITLASSLDRDEHFDTFMLSVQAANKHDLQLRDKFDLKLSIDDINDMKPIFKSSNYKFDVNEDSEKGFIVGRLSATDSDSGTNAYIEYRVAKDINALAFDIDKITGELKVNGELDYNTVSEYQLTIVAIDHGSPAQTGTAYVHITINDVNNKSPTFKAESISIAIQEDVSVGRTIQYVQASDDDFGEGGVVHYDIIAGNEQNKFLLDAQTGALVLADELDREVVNSFHLEILAKDGGLPPLSGRTSVSIVIKDVNDNIPVFSQSQYAVSISRFSSINTFVAMVTAVDQDAGSNADVQYTLKAAEQELFQIHLTTGEITTFADLSEMEDEINVTVVASDDGRPRMTSSVLIIISMFPPLRQGTEDFVFNVSENSPPNTLVGNIGRDDRKDVFTYTLLSGNYKNAFRINPRDGSVYQNGILDREEFVDYFLLVEILDSRRPGFHKNRIIHIQVMDENDNSPIFSEETYRFSVLENTPVEYIIGEIAASDRDMTSNGEVRYGLLSGSSSGDSFRVNSNGSISVGESLFLVVGLQVNLTVFAKDQGQPTRQTTAVVELTIIDLPGHFPLHPDSSASSSLCISLEIPDTASSGYKVTSLTPKLFNLNSSDDTSYISQGRMDQFKIDHNSGDVSVADFNTILSSGTKWPTLLWAVAQSHSGPESSLALLRIDRFSPTEHVVVMIHDVALEYLQFNRADILIAIQQLFPTGRPVIWKIEGDNSSFRRKLLFARSRTYVYVIKDASVDTLQGLERTKEYYTQKELLFTLSNPDGTVTSSLTQGAMATLPVIDVVGYVHPNDYIQEWIATPTGKAVLAVSVVTVTFILISCLVYWECAKRNRKVAAKKPRAMSLNIPPLSTEIVRSRCYNCNTIKTTAASGEALPLINALRILSSLSEQEREKLIQQTFNSPKQGDKEKLQKTISNVNNLNKSVAKVTITNEVSAAVNVHQKHSEKDKRPSNNGVLTSSAVSSVTPSSSCLSLASLENTNTTFPEVFYGPGQKESSTVTSEDESVSSLELDTDRGDDTASESKVKVTNQLEVKAKSPGPIIIGGKEYDGVGKDTLSNKKYMYNTKTGEKLEVTDDVLKRAIEQRQSVVTPDFNQENDKSERKKSGLKSPIRRKTSRTRFSTTTIWEMSVDEDSDNEVFTESDSKSTDNKMVTAAVSRDNSIAGRSRKCGVDLTRKIEADGLGKELSKLSLRKQVTESEAKKQTGPVSKSTVKFLDDKEEESADDSSKELEKDEVLRKISVRGTWDSVLDKTVTKDEMKSARKKSFPEDSEESLQNPGWSKAHSVVRFVRPIYKPLNLDNVTSKIPKGKSDPKDCLSKDPVYAGWAKMVGRRMTKKVTKDKTVTVREGRSLPPNLAKAAGLLPYTEHIKNKVPHHLHSKHLSVDIKT